MNSQKQEMQDSMKREEQQNQKNTSGQNSMIQIGICNQTGKAHDADIWIIQDNQKNRKTSSWGPVTAGKLDTGNARDIAVTEAPDGRYLIRIIDASGLYYEANGLLLKNGETIVIKDGSEKMSAIVEVQAEEGRIVCSYDMFVASL